MDWPRELGSVENGATRCIPSRRLEPSIWARWKAHLGPWWDFVGGPLGAMAESASTTRCIPSWTFLSHVSYGGIHMFSLGVEPRQLVFLLFRNLAMAMAIAMPMAMAMGPQVVRNLAIAKGHAHGHGQGPAS